MFIHFAFGSLGKQGNIEEQTHRVIECILREKRLKVSKCKEFIPIFPDQSSKPIPLKPFRKVEGRTDLVVAAIDGDRLTDTGSIGYLPEDVPMICFIKIAFSQLKKSKHPQEYGKFGIVLTTDFLMAMGIRQVRYYTEESLWRDPLILKWNQNWAKGKLSNVEAKQLQREITAYRKPAKLFPSFAKSITHIVQFGSGHPQTDYFTYNRYTEGYEFTKENEYRIVFDESVECLYFDESDAYMIIVPSSQTKNEIETYLNRTWNKRPQVMVFPS